MDFFCGILLLFGEELLEETRSFVSGGNLPPTAFLIGRGSLAFDFGLVPLLLQGYFTAREVRL